MDSLKKSKTDMEVQSTVGRTETDFNNEWKFLKLTQKGGLSELTIEATEFEDRSWESISLPHTWNAVDGANGWTGKDEGGEDYYRGLGGYRKSAYISEKEYGGKRVFIEFEGANTVTELFINGSSAGRHEGGYSAFRFDITPFIRLDEENVFAVKVNNALAVLDGFSENAKQQLTELIRQNYNHPSIIVWGISNELYQMTDEIYAIYTELCELTNKEDETRPITMADNQSWGRFMELPTDVVGYNRYFGWYKDAGPAENYGA